MLKCCREFEDEFYKLNKLWIKNDNKGYIFGSILILPRDKYKYQTDNGEKQSE